MRKQLQPIRRVTTGPTPLAGAGPSASGARAWLTWLAWVVATVVAGAAMGMLFPPDEWYGRIAKPTWMPPAWLFGPVWTLLYVLLGSSAWLVSREQGVSSRDRRIAWTAFAAHAAFNLAWTPLFFGLRQPGLAFFDICLVWLALLWMVLQFGRIRPLAGYLLLPQVLWVSFALVLNGTLWLMNT